MSSIPRARFGPRFCGRVSIGALLPLMMITHPAAAQDLTLSDALSRVALVDPSVTANAARLQAASAAILQADVRPRDTIGIDIEDFAGTGDYSPVERSQTTTWYERIWERGGKREARIETATSETSAVVQRNKLRLLDLFARVQGAWVDAMAAEAAIPVAQQKLDAAQRIETEVDRRVARALDPLFARERARTAVAQARIDIDQARERARITRTMRANYWGGAADFQLDATAFALLEAPAGTVEDAPDLTALSAERDAAEARVRLAQTGNVGNATARVGLRHFGQGSDIAMVVGGSIPLGNRAANRGNIARAEADQLAAEADIAVARVERKREIDQLAAERGMIAREIDRIDRDVLPSAQRAVTLVRDGFARGGTAFTYLEVSQAQQAVIDARARRIDLLRRFHLAGVRLDRLTGRHAALLSLAENRR
jgi:cobalt-zinc-cadmium efflux system outer membrane protein